MRHCRRAARSLSTRARDNRNNKNNNNNINDNVKGARVRDLYGVRVLGAHCEPFNHRYISRKRSWQDIAASITFIRYIYIYINLIIYINGYRESHRVLRGRYVTKCSAHKSRCSFEILIFKSRRLSVATCFTMPPRFAYKTRPKDEWRFFLFLFFTIFCQKIEIQYSR